MGLLPHLGVANERNSLSNHHNPFHDRHWCHVGMERLMNTQALKTVRRLFNVDYIPREQNRHNQRAWVRSVRSLGSRWLLTQKVEKK